ncbi:MAG: phenylalanine--tRNA ligase subunit beta [Casimicrobiaceae bacterium]|nr:phenylalanine--tRNA ligase subunit beta [Casimicrobiaceae bacterium]
MLIPELWLRSFCDPALTTQEIAQALTMGGLEVESVRRVAPPFSQVVVGEILACEKHPNADRLTVCRVNTGTAEPLSIVCGAPNVRVGMRVPCALVGAELPPGEEGQPIRIARAVVRGVESHGMLCSARELGLAEDRSGLMELAADAPVGMALREYLRLDEAVFEIKLTPNRADALSVYGVARDLSAITATRLMQAPMRRVVPRLTETLPVRIEAPDLCGRFAGRIIRGVDAKAPTPAWMRERLERAGQRSISALVDISNYVMLELGRPSHVFDLDRVEGPLVVRWARPGETLELLNGQTVALDPAYGVIAAGEKPESLAGIMGGQATAVTSETRNVYLEAAFWHPEAIQGRARRLGFSTEAAHRFERGVDWATIPEHLDYLTGLILEICGGEAGPIDDHVLRLPERQPIRMRVARARKVIGLDLPADTMSAIFTRLGLPNERSGAGDAETITVTPPSYRFDLAIEEDLIEEVARIHGFDAIPARPPLARAAMRARPEGMRSLHALRAFLAARDYFEVINYAFVEPEWETDIVGNPDPIRLLNPIASHLAVMRSSLIPGLLANVRFNASRRLERVRVFELGKVFRRDASVGDGASSVAGVAQPLRLGGVAWGSAWPEQWGATRRGVDFFDVKGDLEPILPPGTRFERVEHRMLHPGRAARLVSNGRVVGLLGELHPRHWARFDLSSAPIVFELEVAALVERGVPTAQPVSPQPTARRDLALVLDDQVEVGALLEHLRVRAPAVVRAVDVFDVFRGAGLPHGKKSVAIRILMQDFERTLADSEIEAVVGELLRAASEAFGACLRT